jgi:hypothetical protein
MDWIYKSIPMNNDKVHYSLKQRLINCLTTTNLAPDERKQVKSLLEILDSRSIPCLENEQMITLGASFIAATICCYYPFLLSSPQVNTLFTALSVEYDLTNKEFIQNKRK